MPHQMHDTGLDGRIREGGSDGFGEALQPIHDGDQDVLHAPVLQLVHYRQPELGAFILSNPQAKNLAHPVTGDAEGHINRLVLDHPAVGVADLDPKCVEDHDGIHTVQRPGLPFADLV